VPGGLHNFPPPPHHHHHPGQVDRKYILAKAGRCLLCFDQHAVDERVRVERLERELVGGRLDSAPVVPGAKGNPNLAVSASAEDQLRRHREVGPLRLCEFVVCNHHMRRLSVCV
jgi:hypothetical protein